ncbi:30S ribosomal protein [Actinidia chinensis var. chinensis]|uniref:30S ribosomal protein n=1 Tax=Actinidia chinensis var. chinensis TaxID=1590841 RepID=A0A2R6RRA1_ACTCC|nr:30S ribosomal protein [Actinidia chinensis var. chinensis]
MTRNRFVRSPVAFVCVVVSVCCLLVVIITVLNLPEVLVADSKMASFRPRRIKKVLEAEKIGQFGEMIIEMLPEDLAFTVFVPSGRAVARDLRLNVNDSLTGDKFHNAHAILTRILGFSAVPRTISSVFVPSGEDVIGIQCIHFKGFRWNADS